jgi:hypothetical protein
VLKQVGTIFGDVKGRVEIIFLIVGLILIAVGGVVIFSEVQARRETLAVGGHVIGYSTGRSSLNSFSFHSVAEYVGPDGRTHYAEAAVGSSIPLYAVGTPATILVRPTEPEKAVFSSHHSYTLGSILVLMGLASTTVFWITFRTGIFSIFVAGIVASGFALKIKKAWREKPLSLQEWREYKKQVLTPRVFQSKDEIPWADPISISAALQTYQKSRRFSVPILLLLGLGLLLGSHYSYKKTESFLQRADRSFGQVIELREIEAHDNGSNTYAAVVEYTDRQDQRRKFVDSFSSNPPSYQTGQRVGILYNRDNPGDAQIDRGPWIYWLTVLLGQLGALFTLLGVSSARKWSRTRA